MSVRPMMADTKAAWRPSIRPSRVLTFISAARGSSWGLSYLSQNQIPLRIMDAIVFPNPPVGGGWILDGFVRPLVRALFVVFLRQN